MKLKEITFEENYLYEKPDGNYWRGINVRMGGVAMLRIELYQGDLCITCGNGTIPYQLYYMDDETGLERIDFHDYDVTEGSENYYDDDKYGGLRFKLEDKEKAKERAVEIIQRYFAVFIEQE